MKDPNLDVQRIRMHFDVKARGMQKAQTEERKSLYSDIQKRGLIDSGIAYQEITQLFTSQIEKMTQVYFDILVENLPSIPLSGRHKNDFINAIENFVEQLVQKENMDFQQRLARDRIDGELRDTLLRLLPLEASEIKEHFKQKLNLAIQVASKPNGVHFLKTQAEEIWKSIQDDYEVNKQTFGKKINFVSDKFKRRIIFRDIEHAYVLASNGFSKPAVILAGSVIEELLRLFLKSRNVKPANNSFDEYIKTCETQGLLKHPIRRLSDSVRHFRNLVHMAKEESPQHTISKATAKGAVSSIFTIVNDF